MTHNTQVRFHVVKFTYRHPYKKPHPAAIRQLHHHQNVQKYAKAREKGHERNLGKKHKLISQLINQSIYLLINKPVNKSVK